MNTQQELGVSLVLMAVLQLAEGSVASSGTDVGVEIRVEATRLSPEGRLIIEAKFQKVFQIHLISIVHDIPGGTEVKAKTPKSMAPTQNLPFSTLNWKEMQQGCTSLSQPSPLYWPENDASIPFEELHITQTTLKKS